MDCPSSFARLTRFGAMTLALSGPGVSTALAQELYARRDGAACAPASRPVPDHALAGRRSDRSERLRQPSGRLA
jgi:hypothetical protein